MVQSGPTQKPPPEPTTNQSQDSFAVAPAPTRVDSAGSTAKAPSGGELSPTGDEEVNKKK